MAISADPGLWFLVNASPDFAFQVSSFPDLYPSHDSLRNSPIRGVLLTNSDLDHVLGLFSFREGDLLRVYGTAAVRASVSNSLGLEQVLNAFCGVKWLEPPTDHFEALEASNGSETRLRFKAIELPGGPPRFQPSDKAGTTIGHSVAYLFESADTNRRLLVAPDVAAVTPALREALTSADAVLFDGTFWSGDELRSIRPGAPQASEMGHVTIRDCSLDLLRGLRAHRKVLIHINNTNPILMEDSPERQAVEAAGITVGWDGLEFEV